MLESLTSRVLVALPPPRDLLGSYGERFANLFVLLPFRGEQYDARSFDLAARQRSGLRDLPHRPSFCIFVLVITSEVQH
jgi:hypothetical protein